MNLDVQDLALGPLPQQKWCHAVRTRFAADPLWCAPTQQSRFKAGAMAMRVLYFAWDEATALREVGAPTGSASAWSTFEVAVQLSQVADLRSCLERGKAATTVQELTGDWKGYARRNVMPSTIASAGVAPTQDFGAALYANTNCEAFLTPSARNPLLPNLVIFPDRVKIDGGSLAVASK